MEQEPMVFVTKAIEFSATHRLFNPEFDAATNERIFGKCNNPNGHGHNYRLEVTVRGDPDPKTGMVINLSRLKDILNDEVMTRFDHKNLNLDVSEMKNQIPTAENIAIVVWDLLSKKLGATLMYRVRIHETQNNVVEYLGPS